MAGSIVNLRHRSRATLKEIHWAAGLAVARVPTGRAKRPLGQESNEGAFLLRLSTSSCGLSFLPSGVPRIPLSK